MSDDTWPEDLEVRESAIGGRGVHARVAISAGAWLAVKPRDASVGVARTREDIPDDKIHLCISLGAGMWHSPRDFGNLEPVWLLNHSDIPNARRDGPNYYASRDIAAGEEITIDYRIFDEPAEDREPFYLKPRGASAGA